MSGVSAAAPAPRPAQAAGTAPAARRQPSFQRAPSTRPQKFGR